MTSEGWRPIEAYPSTLISEKDLITSLNSEKLEDLTIQSTLVISTSVISNNRLSRRGNLIIVST